MRNNQNKMAKEEKREAMDHANLFKAKTCYFQGFVMIFIFFHVFQDVLKRFIDICNLTPESL